MDVDPKFGIESINFSSTKKAINVSSEHKNHGKESKTTFSIDTEDIIAIIAGLIALMFAVAMIAGWVPIDKSTIGLASFSGAGAVVAKIIQARNKKKDTSETPAKPEPNKTHQHPHKKKP